MGARLYVTSVIVKKSPTSGLVPPGYWHATLVEANLWHPKIPPDAMPFTITSQEGRWQVTNALPSTAKWIEKQFSTSKASIKADSDGKPANYIPFVLVPARLPVRAGQGVKLNASEVNSGLSLLCIPCLLDRQGGLSPDPDRHPWIPRDMLEPSLTELTIGNLDDYDRFLGTIPGQPTSLSDAFKTANRLFKEVTGTDLPLLSGHTEDNTHLFVRNDYEIVSAWHGLPNDQQNMAIHLIKLYDQLIDKKPSVPLLDKLLDTSVRQTRNPILYTQAERYFETLVGHIDKQHSLSPSQREAMIELVALKTGEVLAINGPPGTGKTTLLHSVIAQLWVDAALKKTDCPIIVITSTNVKAVENVLDSFGKIEARIGHKRWIQYGGGFGLFLASASRETKFPTCTSDTHPFEDHETLPAVESAHKAYLNHATNYFGKKQDSVKAVVEALHAELKGLQESLQKIVKARYAILSATNNDIETSAVTLCMRFISQYKNEAITSQTLIESSSAAIAQNKSQIKTVEANAEAVLSKIDDAELSWSKYLGTSPFWLGLLSFLPPILRRLKALDRAFLLSMPLTANMNNRHEDITGHFMSLRKESLTEKQTELTKLATDLALAEEQKASAEVSLKTANQGEALIKILLKNWHDALGTKYEAMTHFSLVEMSDKLDTTIRALMFCVADRYWSGMWIIEMQERLDRQIIDTKGPIKLAMKYRRFAKLSPCLVSNFHMAPNFFTAWQGKDDPVPLWNTIDLLIVDEAGQVSPDIGSVMFALAKCALVVGDTSQIEPIWNTGEATDRANAEKFGFTKSSDDPHYDKMESAGYTAARGNLMKIASRGCAIQKYSDLPGLLLTEHRRSVPELIGYCNELVYGGRLVPLRASLDPANRLLPVFGKLDVKGKDTQVGTSRKNQTEAEAIVTWIKDNRNSIENHYRDKVTGEIVPIWKLVGIVTPFKMQATIINRLLLQSIPDLAQKDTKLTVGTVHALQGAERDIIIFSPTYGHGYNGEMFFDQSSHMLNVAVSRAKDSFLIIGNLALFDQKNKNKPSRLLAKYLTDQKISGTI